MFFGKKTWFLRESLRSKGIILIHLNLKTTTSNNANTPKLTQLQTRQPSTHNQQHLQQARFLNFTSFLEFDSHERMKYNLSRS